MAQNRTVHTKHLGGSRHRDLQVYYDKGGINYWDYSHKPKGIYFASHCYTQSGGVMSWSTGQKGDGYICVAQLSTYRPSVLRAVRARVVAQADDIHNILDGNYGNIADLTAYLRGEADLPERELQEAV